ncbi:MAG: N-acetylmuramoyl-L-alanine amidase [Negativicutes bacterium]|nr:N-acetylmuramoyl-L-alanine amidase [Negativicutes bacterium]
MRICLDPGHSGPVEPGACAAGFTEAALNLAIAFQAGGQLAAKGYDVIYTRSGDIDTDGLEFRAVIANEIKADLFISIHCNAAASAEAYGVETYHYPNSAEGRRLAGCIQRELAALNYTRDRGVKENGNLAVLRLTDMPAALVECGFITSEHDRAVLVTDEGQQRIAQAIVSVTRNLFPLTGETDKSYNINRQQPPKKINSLFQKHPFGNISL